MDLMKALNLTMSTQATGADAYAQAATPGAQGDFAALFAALHAQQPNTLTKLPELVAEFDETTELEQLSLEQLEDLLALLLPQLEQGTPHDALTQPEIIELGRGPAEEIIDPQPIVAPVIQAATPVITADTAAAAVATAPAAPATTLADAMATAGTNAALSSHAERSNAAVELPVDQPQGAVLVNESNEYRGRAAAASAPLAPVMPPVETATTPAPQLLADAPRPMPSHLHSQIVMVPSPVTSPATSSLSAPLTSAAWAGQLQQNMVTMVMRNQQEITLRLHPAELGPLQIQLRVEDQQAQLMVLTHSHQVRGAVEQAMPLLRDALANQGIQLDDANVADHGEHFAQQHQQQQEQQQNQSTHPVENSVSAENIDRASIATPLSRPMNGQVDTYA